MNVRKYSNLHLQAALPGQLQPGHEPHRALVGGAREGPAAGGPERLHGHHQHLLRHGLRAGQRAAARPLPAPLPAPGRLGRGRVRAPGRPRTGSSTATTDRGRPLGALRRRPHRRAAVPAQLPRAQPLRRLPLHPLRRELRGGRGRRENAIVGPAAQPVVLRDADRDAGADLLARLRHPGLRLLRALQAHDRARGLLDLPDAGRATSTPSRSSTGTTTSSAPTRSPTRSSSASTRSARGPTGKSPCPTSSSTGGSCRPTTSRSRTGRTTSTRTTRRPRSVPASSPSTSRPLMSRMRVQPSPAFSARLQPRVRRQLQAGPAPEHLRQRERPARRR